MEVDKIYRVREEALTNDARYQIENRNYVNQHGWVWVCVEPPDMHRPWARCRSVSTGHVADWFPRELDLLEE